MNQGGLQSQSNLLMIFSKGFVMIENDRKNAVNSMMKQLWLNSITFMIVVEHCPVKTNKQQHSSN